MLHQQTTALIIRCFYKVYNHLGRGFLESVYEKALKIELENHGAAVKRQSRIEVYYGPNLVGEFCADLIVEDLVIIELKAAESIHPQHEAQLLNYLKATEIEGGLLLNFGTTPQFARRLFTNDMKRSLR